MSAPKRSNDSDPCATPPKKKSKPPASQHFRLKYSKEWPCLQASKHGDSYVRCTVCDSDFSCAHGGKNDCYRHVKSAKHQQFKDAKKQQPTLRGFISKQRDDLEVTRSETYICEFLLEHNLPFAAADTFTKAIKRICPDSKIAKEIKLCRQKATAVVKELSALQMMSLAQRMQQSPFSIATDGSNDNGDKKLFPLVVRIQHQGMVSAELLSVLACEGSATGENIFNLVDQEFTSQRIPWDNCISFGCDNANVMTGWKKGVISFVRGKQPDVHLAGCCLHLVYLSARKGASCLPPVEDVLVDIFHFFQKSTNRQSELKELQSLHDVEQRKMLKHVCTRWLSIQRCLDRMLANWDPLRQYFIEQKKKNEKSQLSSYSKQKVESVADFLRSPTNKIFCLFLQYTIKVFDQVLVKLQAEEPMLHKLRLSLTDLMTDLYSRFLLPTAVCGEDVEKVNFKIKANQKNDEDLLIGAAAREMLDHPDLHHLRENRIKDFYAGVRNYFETVCSYLLQKLPFDDPVLKHAAVLNIEARKTSKLADLTYFLRRFSAVIPEGESIDTLTEQFSKYQMTDVNKLEADRIDSTWSNVAAAHPQFKGLSQAMLGIMTIPHSSSACQRVFSTVRKNATDQRASMNQDTLEAILVAKAKPGHFLDESRQHSNSDLEKLKSAYYLSLKK